MIILSIILSLIIISLVTYKLFFEKVTYLITYATDIKGKRQIDSCEYTVSFRQGLPSSNEFKNYVKSILIESNNLHIIDIHRLS